MKYQRIPEIIDSEEYKEGMEDGFECYDISGKYIGTYDKYQALPKSNRKAYVNIPTGRAYVSKGDFIVTDAYGDKTVYPADVFHKTFEPLPSQGIDIGDMLRKTLARLENGGKQ
jgi:hypothetical protein